MRHQGKITTWKRRQRLASSRPTAAANRFLHVSSLANRQRRPEGNELVSYELATDAKRSGRRRSGGRLRRRARGGAGLRAGRSVLPRCSRRASSSCWGAGLARAAAAGGARAVRGGERGGLPRLRARHGRRCATPGASRRTRCTCSRRSAAGWARWRRSGCSATSLPGVVPDDLLGHRGAQLRGGDAWLLSPYGAPRRCRRCSRRSELQPASPIPRHQNRSPRACPRRRRLLSDTIEHDEVLALYVANRWSSAEKPELLMRALAIRTRWQPRA